MARLQIDAVSKKFDTDYAVREVSLDIADGEFMVLLGPSGCGKSTLLRMIAGLEEPSEGRILVGGNDVTDAAPQRRDLAMVFQSYALYPHLSVASQAEHVGEGGGDDLLDRGGRGAEHRGLE
ncbi:ATP-binding cassette domain-containing protein, partial [Nocardia sp. NPDC003648]